MSYKKDDSGLTSPTDSCLYYCYKSEVFLINVSFWSLTFGETVTLIARLYTYKEQVRKSHKILFRPSSSEAAAPKSLRRDGTSGEARTTDFLGCDKLI